MSEIERGGKNDTFGKPDTSAPAKSSRAANAAHRKRVGKAHTNKLVNAVVEDVGSLAFRFRLVNAILFFCPHFALNRFRTAVYRAGGLKIGRGTLVLGGMELCGQGRYWERLTIGNDCQITTPLYVDLNSEITCGDKVAIGHHVVLVTTGHKYDDPRHRCGEGIYEPIVIEDGAWIGANVTVLPGVTIGAGSIVAAGAVVSKSVPPHTVVGGIPARVIRELPH